MQAIRLKATVPENRELKIQLPDTIQPGQVEVLVLREEEVKQPASLLQILDEIESSSEPGNSLENLDKRLSDERASWE
jgi:LysM repeat protein